MIKVALTGRLRSGKDSVAARLYTEHGFAYPLAFGSVLKRQYHALFPWIAENPKPRAGYQQFGQLIRKEFGEDVWIRHIERSVEGAAMFRDTQGIVITDVRQPNEYDWCKRNGFVIVRVVSPLEARVKRAEIAGDAFELADLEHDTEKYVDSFEVDAEIINDGSLTELHANVDDMMTKIKSEGGR